MTTAITTTKSVITDMANRFGMEKEAFEAVMKKTVFPAGKSNEEFVGFLLVAKAYNLNPLLKEVYAFPTKSGGIMPIVSIDGWLNIINTHPQFNGMEFIDKFDDNGKIISITCRIHRKDRTHVSEVTEYLAECQGTSEPWRKWPVRMLRHKATIQAARYAFGFSGIYDEDEAKRMDVVEITTSIPQQEKPVITATKPTLAQALKQKTEVAEDVVIQDDLVAKAQEFYGDEV